AGADVHPGPAGAALGQVARDRALRQMEHAARGDERRAAQAGPAAAAADRVPRRAGPAGAALGQAAGDREPLEGQAAAGRHGEHAAGVAAADPQAGRAAAVEGDRVGDDDPGRAEAEVRVVRGQGDGLARKASVELDEVRLTVARRVEDRLAQAARAGVIRVEYRERGRGE